ncbi:ATP-binding cassette domain-containing protein [Azoarcus indigens]|uniref:Amino acid/amide ABC transporter ATP-binding protein 2 (HAAT family) n=1 Tax=Azoarcus indigens TaxID=29545 RepID=A0A4R6DMM9_9RHOO|nr:ABC transporter ATP-binding protein [Azoarcus indigens]NMG65751.1 ATP-binding cassette domain-containing protein [Azoarcus indigens]TDN46107.1 amino acid/amide ABC transporter ATP-binding protein 2 (HAAT family) [Azoarcus indigens]
MLEILNLSVAYGRNEALRKVNLKVEEGKIVTVLGANGAGKSTLLNAILGMVKPRDGQILLGRDDITLASPSERVARGIVLVPEGRRILITMTIEENLMLGAHLRKDHAAVKQELDAIYARFPNLAERRHMAAACLSGGEQQMLAIGRALLARPRLIMLDEPSLGLSPLFVAKLFELLREINRDGLTVLLVEQNTGKALANAHYAAVLELGQVVMAGEPAVLAADPRLQEAYLGRAGDGAHG